MFSNQMIPLNGVAFMPALTRKPIPRLQEPQMASTEKIKALFEDLGKPTLRGVRKCPKCGTYNGTRGISCKNKACNVVFKEKEKKRGHSADAVKIITGSTGQVFSVRLRDRGPDYRGFVQLPLVQDLDGNPAPVVDPVILYQAARCFVDSCTRSSQQGLLEQPCSHIKAAVECQQEATPLTLKNSVLNTLQVPNEIKQAIWLLATETTGPLVQRVTKNIMVVKCKPNSKQPLGFLHFSLFETTRNRSSPEHKFHCCCKAFKYSKPGAVSDSQKRCVHFYACICAFASDEKLSEEFSYYINLDSQDISQQESPERQIVTIYQAQDTGLDTGDPTTLEVVVTEDELLEPPIKKPRKDDTLVQASNALLTLQEGSTVQNPQSPRKISPQKIQSKVIAPNNKKTPVLQIDESQVAISFHQWLASVTERINQTMHYQFDGNPDPLVFHAPQVFFDCLQQRISSGSKKKRLPNFTTGFVRKDALPLGMFTKYTWHITNLFQVKMIFDTPEAMAKIWIILFSFILILVTTESAEQLSRKKRIIGGQPITKGDWPWLVSLRGKIVTKRLFGIIPIEHKRLYCGGSIINERWIMTAAHCFDEGHEGRKPSNWKARLSTVDLSVNFVDGVMHVFGTLFDQKEWRQVFVDVDRIIMHPDYNKNNDWENDIALIRLEESVTISNHLRNIPLPPPNASFPEVGQMCAIHGWGCTANGQWLSSKAMSVNLPVYDKDNCQRMFAMKSMNNRLCAGYIFQEKGICKGDSGGPLVCTNNTGEWVQAGIASFASMSHPGNFPGVFTRVSSFVHWINRVISGY